MDLNPSALEKWLNECQRKIMAKYMNKSKAFGNILSFSADPLLRLTSQKTGVYVLNLLC